MPAKAVKKIKFLNKHNLNEFVPKESAMVSWGGEDYYEFSFEPETKKAEEIKKKVISIICYIFIYVLILIYLNEYYQNCMIIIINCVNKTFTFLFSGSFC